MLTAFKEFSEMAVLRNLKFKPKKKWETDRENLKRESLLATAELEDLVGFTLEDYDAKARKCSTNDTEIGPIQCIVWHPEKQSNINSGVIVCLHGNPTTKAL